MTGGASGVRRQIAELRMLVAQAAAARTAETIDQDADSVRWAERVSGLVLDPWQRDVLLSNDARLALLACRQSGKSTIVALMASNIVRQGGMAITVSPSLRQSSLLFRKLHHLLVTGGESFRRETQTELETLSGGVALCLPGDRPDMLRGLSLRWPTTSLLIVDEAARVRESMWSVISPMLAAAPTARQALLSTPAGASGEFHRVMVKRRSRLAADHHSGGGLQPHRAGLPRPRAHPAWRRAVSARVSLRVHRLAWLGIFRRNPERDVRRSRRKGM